MSQYKVAIVIPCWNCEQYIGELLTSLQNQTFHQWEAFFVDDCSTDNTAFFIKQFSAHDTRFHYVLRPRLPKGAQTCRNVGFELSSNAEYVIFLDADDLIAPYCLEQRVSYMDSRPDLDFGVFMAKSFIERPLEINDSLLFGFKYPAIDDLRRLLRRSHPFVVCTNIYRKASIDKSGIRWDEELLSLQDSDFNLQSFQKNLKYDYAENNRIDYFYRTWHSSESTSRKIASGAHKKSHLYFLNKLYYTLSPEKKTRYKLEIEDYILYFVEKFVCDRDFISRLLHSKWTRNRLWFRVKVRLYCVLKRNGRSGKRWLFPSLYSFRTKDDLEYRKYQDTLLTDACMKSAI